MTETVHASYWQTLRDRRLAVLLAGFTLSTVGDGAVVVALPVQALRVHGQVSAALAVALVAAAPYVLSLPLSLLFGLSRRRFRPRALLVADCLLRCGGFALLGVLSLAGALGLSVLAGLLCGVSVLRLLAASSRRLVAAGMAAPDSRFAVNGLLGLSGSVAAYVAGPVVGGVVSAVASPGLVLLVDAASFLPLCAVVLLVVRPVPSAEAGHGRSSSGWRLLRARPVVVRLMVVVFLFDLFYGPVEVALPLFVRGPLHADPAALGFVWGGFGAGALVGSVATNRLRDLPYLPVLLAIVAGWGLTVALLAAAPGVAVAACVMGFGGVIYAPFTPVAYSFVQSTLDDEALQPVTTLWNVGDTVAMPLGLALGGPLVQAAGSRGGLLVSAVLTVALVPCAAPSLARRVAADL